MLISRLAGRISLARRKPGLQLLMVHLLAACVPVFWGAHISRLVRIQAQRASGWTPSSELFTCCALPVRLAWFQNEPRDVKVSTAPIWDLPAGVSVARHLDTSACMVCQLQGMGWMGDSIGG